MGEAAVETLERVLGCTLQEALSLTNVDLSGVCLVCVCVAAPGAG
jgi:hypothetical protein